MLRRVAPALRTLLLIVGVALVVCLPLSCVCEAWVVLPSPWAWTAVYCDDAQLGLWVEPGPIDVRPRAGLAWSRPPDGWRTITALPRINTVQGFATDAAIPIWMVAAICLAWPVTSFILARRRRRAPGFEVQTKVESAVSTADS